MPFKRKIKSQNEESDSDSNHHQQTIQNPHRLSFDFKNHESYFGIPNLNSNQSLGYIETTMDALFVFQAVLEGSLPKVKKRLPKHSTDLISSGSIFVYDAEESGIRRWTDGRTWSPSRIIGNFLVYKELDQMMDRTRITKPSSKPINDGKLKVLSSKGIYTFKKNGLEKKTISLPTKNGKHTHLVSYYRKSDVTGIVDDGSCSLLSVSFSPLFKDVEISADILQTCKRNFRLGTLKDLLMPFNSNEDTTFGQLNAIPGPLVEPKEAIEVKEKRKYVKKRSIKEKSDDEEEIDETKNNNEEEEGSINSSSTRKKKKYFYKSDSQEDEVERAVDLRGGGKSGRGERKSRRLLMKEKSEEKSVESRQSEEVNISPMGEVDGGEWMDLAEQEKWLSLLGSVRKGLNENWKCLLR